MPQQLNLYRPVLPTQKRYFSAAVMVQALVVFILAGVALVAYEVADLRRESEALKRTLQAQTQQLEGLQQTITRRKAAAARPAGLTLAQDLQARRAELLRLEHTLAWFQQGLFRPGEGHAARLALVAGSIPATAWVTLIKADPERMEVSGYTFDPASLNGWIRQLAASPLLTGQRLAEVSVAKVINANTNTKTGAGGAASEASPPVWSFSLVNSLDKPLSESGGSR